MKKRIMTMLFALCTMSAAWAQNFTIGSDEDWNTFATNVNNGTTYSTVTLTADINVSTMVGTSDHPFSGTFRGNGKTLTVSISTQEALPAPFHYIHNATIENVVVNGEVACSNLNTGNHAAGLVGGSTEGGTNVIRNCIVNANVSAYNYAGGIMGHGGNNTSLTMENCTYTGIISSFRNYTGGLLGWGDKMNLTISNCLFRGSFTPGTNGVYTPVGCCNNTNDITATITAYYLNTITATATNHLLPNSGGTPVSASFSFGAWDRALEGPDGNVYYLASDGTLPTSGYCGDPSVNGGKNVTWSYDPTTHTLTINGIGAMLTSTNYSASDFPWIGYQSELTTVIIDDGVTTVGGYAFQDYTALTSAVIGNDVTDIEHHAFYDCTSLSQITLGNSLERLHGVPFMHSALTEVTIPASVTEMGQCFWGCNSLTTVNMLTTTPPSISNATFKECPLAQVQVPYSAILDYVQDEKWSAYINVMKIDAKKPGDLNGDGKLTIVDVTLLVDAIMFPQVEDNHKYVDLALPSGTLWATMNVGANNIEDYGSYFAWGDTIAYGEGKTSFGWVSYAYGNGTRALTKYCPDSSYGNEGYTDNLTELVAMDDPATVKWGRDWRSPSNEQFAELFNSNNTTTSWTTMNGVNGLLVTSRNNRKSIFLPAGGQRLVTTVRYEGTEGYYWSRLLYTATPSKAYHLSFSSESSISASNYSFRYFGMNIRPVRVSR